MAKKLFKNYEFEFDKNDKKILLSFCKQFVKQLEVDPQYFKETKIFNSIIDKLNDAEGKIKLTKEEKTKLTLQLKENVKYLQKEITKAWFIKRWLIKSMYKQYSHLLNKHFSD